MRSRGRFEIRNFGNAVAKQCRRLERSGTGSGPRKRGLVKLSGFAVGFPRKLGWSEGHGKDRDARFLGATRRKIHDFSGGRAAAGGARGGAEEDAEEDVMNPRD